MKLFRHTAEVLALFAIVISGHAGAQSSSASSISVNAAIETWSREKGVVVTKEVREQVARDLAHEFANKASDGGLKMVDARKLGGVIAAGGTVEMTFRGKTVKMVGRSDTGGAIAYANSSDWGWLLRLPQNLINAVGPTLAQFPQLHVLVQPVPPRDYSVKINDTTYPATELSLYSVPPSAIVIIERAGKPPCKRSFMMSGVMLQEFPCTL